MRAGFYLNGDVCALVPQDFEEAIALLNKCGAVHVGQQEVTASDWEVLSFLQTLLQPFVDSYQVLCILPLLISFIMVHLKACLVSHLKG